MISLICYLTELALSVAMLVSAITLVVIRCSKLIKAIKKVVLKFDDLHDFLN